MLRLLSSIWLGLLMCSLPAWGQNLATWDMSGTNGSSSKSASTTNSGIQPPTMTIGSGLVAHNYSNVNGFEVRSVNSTSLNQAINNNEYFSFSITPKSGKKFSVTQIRMRPYSQNRSRSFAVFSSVNGFSSGQVIGSKSYQGNSGSGSFKNVNVSGHNDLTTAVEFRVYVYANQNQEWESCGFAGSGDDFRVVGTSGNASNTFSLTINASNGSVTKSPNKASYNSGETVTLTANPNSGYQFDNWSGALSGSQNPKTLTMNGNKTVTANFSSTGGGGGGGGGGSCGQTLSGTLKVEHCEPANGDTYPSGSAIVIKPNFTSDITKVTFWVDGWNWIGSKSSPPFEFTWNGASDGTHKIRIRGENASGTNTPRKDIDITVGGSGGGGGGGSNSLSVSPSNLSFNNSGGTATINVSSNISWSASDNRGWISVSPANGSNNGSVTVTVNSYSGTNNRNGTVTISGSGLSETVSITQTPPSGGGGGGGGGNANMGMGTNFWFLANWANAMPFKSNIPTNPYSSGFNVWDQTFLNELSIYSCLRFMDWGVTNTYSKSSWGQRRLPDSPTNFDGTSIGTGGNDGLREGLAYEWMIDLCNRTSTDMWVCLPRAADNNYVTQLATLIKNNLNSGLKVYVEYSNEVWNGGTFPQTVAYTAAQGTAIGLTTPEDFFRSVQYAAYRSIQIWELFEAVWGNQSNRVINVLGGQSTNEWIMENRVWPVIFDSPTYNPNNRIPEALAIAPYFGGNGLNGAANNVFDLLRQDINGPRPGGGDGRATDVQQWHALAQSKGVPSLIAYEGGQHIDVNPTGPNRDPEMYDVYVEYLNAIDDYMDLFCHYTHAGQTGNAFWGAKEFHGQSESVAHKYRALKNYANGTARTTSNEPQASLQEKTFTTYPNPVGDRLQIESKTAQTLDVRLMSLTGQMLIEQHVDRARLKLDVSQLPAGVYLLAVNGEVERLVKR